MTGEVLVTGAAGFLGGHICARFADAGWRVTGFDVAPANVTRWPHREGSILDAESLTEAARGKNVIVHAAAIAHLWTRDPRDYFRVNADGTRRVAQCAADVGARLVHVSSYTTLIGKNADETTPLDEGVVLAPDDLLGPYPASKREAELRVLDLVRAGLDAVIVLPSSPVGPGDRRITPPTQMLIDMAKGALPAYLDCMLNMVDARAVADGVFRAVTTGVKGERYLLTGEDIAFADLAAKVAALTGKAAPKMAIPYGLAWTTAMVEAGVSNLTGRAPKAPLTGVRLARRRVRFSHAKASESFGYHPGTIDDALFDSLGWLAAEGLISQPSVAG